MSKRPPVTLLPKKTAWSMSGIKCMLWEKPKIAPVYNDWPCPSDIANEIQQDIRNQISQSCRKNSSGGGTNTGPGISLPSVPKGVLVGTDATHYYQHTTNPKYSACGISCSKSSESGAMSGSPYAISSSGPGKCNNFFDPGVGPCFRKIHDKTICSSKKKVGMGDKVKVKLTYEVNYGVELTCDDGSRKVFRAKRTFTKDIDTYYERTLEATRREIRREEKYCCRGRQWNPCAKCW